MKYNYDYLFMKIGTGKIITKMPLFIKEREYKLNDELDDEDANFVNHNVHNSFTGQTLRKGLVIDGAVDKS